MLRPLHVKVNKRLYSHDDFDPSNFELYLDIKIQFGFDFDIVSHKNPGCKVVLLLVPFMSGKCQKMPFSESLCLYKPAYIYNSCDEISKAKCLF